MKQKCWSLMQVIDAGRCCWGTYAIPRWCCSHLHCCKLFHLVVWRTAVGPPPLVNIWTNLFSGTLLPSTGLGLFSWIKMEQFKWRLWPLVLMNVSDVKLSPELWVCMTLVQETYILRYRSIPCTKLCFASAWTSVGWDLVYRGWMFCCSLTATFSSLLVHFSHLPQVRPGFRRITRKPACPFTYRSLTRSSRHLSACIKSVSFACSYATCIMYT